MTSLGRKAFCFEMHRPVVEEPVVRPYSIGRGERPILSADAWFSAQCQAASHPARMSLLHREKDSGRRQCLRGGLGSD